MLSLYNKYNLLETAIDIYTKLVVAFISFTTPVIVYLLSVFSDGISIVRLKFEEEEKQIDKLIKVNSASGTKNIKEIKNGIALLSNAEAKNKKALNLLNPKRQIVRIFSLLALALLLIVVYSLVKDKTLDIYNHSIAVSLVVLSVSFFILALWCLQKVAWAAIDMKRRIADDKPSSTISKLNVKP